MKNGETMFLEESNSIDLLQDDDDMMIASIDLFHVDEDGECNRNECNISMETAKKSLKTFLNKPIIARFNSIVKEFVTDVTEHAKDATDFFNTRVVGHIPADSRIKFIERDNGKTYCNAEAVIQKRYVPELYNILKNNDGQTKVSIEIKAKGNTNDDGIFVIDDFKLEGICLLGENVVEGIEGSHLEVLKFSKKEIAKINEYYCTFAKKKENNSVIDMMKQEIHKEFSMGIKELQELIWKDLSKYEYSDGEWKGLKYYAEEIYTDEKVVIVRDNETAKYYKVAYKIDNDNVVLDMTSKTEVHKEWHERPLNEERFSIAFAKEDYGAGEAVKVDKSRQAMSDKAWGDVDKTELRHKVLNAKNYKTLVYDVYALVEDGWEVSPSSKLKYPIMLIEGNTAVYSRYGLASALGYARAEGEKSVIDKVEKLYKTMDIDEKEDKMDNEQDIENKLDENNPEIEKIKDDADAIEDDKKEEVEKKVENAVVDAPEEDKLKDDIDSDKDYWKDKYLALENELAEVKNLLNSCQEELKVYKDKEDKENMKEYLNSYKMCFSEEELSVMASKIDTMNRVDFEKEVDNSIKAFVKMKFAQNVAKKEETVEINNSYGFMANPTVEKKIENRPRNIDDVLNNLGN